LRIRVVTAGALTRSIPEGRVDIERQDLTVRGVIEALKGKYGPTLASELLDQEGIKEGLCMLVNGRNILSLPQRYETPLRDGDEVLIALVVAGG
jgi:molybdopterin converting factor small subunit